MVLLANLLTLLRIIIIPFIMRGFFMADKFRGAELVFWLFIIASITDYFDGFVARKFNATSKFGRMLDPIADKMLVAAVLILLAYDRQLNGLPRADLIPVIIIILREILVSGLREFLAMENVAMPVTKLAKWKTTFQFLALLALLGAPLAQGVVVAGLPINTQQAGQILLWVAALLTAITGWKYFRYTCGEAFKGNKILEIKMVKTENPDEDEGG